MTLAAQLLDAAKARDIMIGTAESCTGGLVSAAITDVPGSSAVFDRGFVVYTYAAKMQMLGVSAVTLDAHGAVSEQVAREMAQGVLANSDSNMAVSVTGIAGPGASEFKPEGRVCFGIARPGVTYTETVEFGALGRDKVRRAARDHALTLMLRALTPE